MKSRETELFYYYLAVDLFILNAALCVLAWLNFHISAGNYYQISPILLHGNLSWIITYFAFTKKNLYLRDKFKNRIWRITQRHVIFLFVAAFLSLIFFQHNFPRKFFAEYSSLFYIEKIIFYWIFYKYVRFRRKNRINTTNAAIVGCNETGFLLKRIIESNASLGYLFNGFICSNNNENIKYLGHPDDIEKIIDDNNLNMIFYTISFFNGDNAEKKGKEVLKICNRKGIRLRFIPKNQRWFRNRMNMESIGEFVVINPQEIPLDNAGSRVQKRVFDIVFSSLVIIFLLSWLVPIIGLLIKLESKGPIFFIQERTGINNLSFKCLKFRSMKVNKQANDKQASVNDSRITKLGSFLRKSNLDELPQFFNVFAGSMSVVGPRPHMLKHTEEYSKLIDYYLIRHYVKPGITGWAQVMGYRGETKELSAMQQRVKADMEYIENWTFTWDLKIIWLTLFGKNSYKNAG